MDEKKINETVLDNTDLKKAVDLLEENGFYVVFADTGIHAKKYTGALKIRAYPKRTTAITYFSDNVVKI